MPSPFCFCHTSIAQDKGIGIAGQIYPLPSMFFSDDSNPLVFLVLHSTFELYLLHPWNHSLGWFQKVLILPSGLQNTGMASCENVMGCSFVVQGDLVQKYAVVIK